MAEDVRDVGLRGKPDDDIFKYAAAHDLALLSADLSFGNLQRFPLGTHAGIVIARFPNEVSTRVFHGVEEGRELSDGSGFELLTDGVAPRGSPTQLYPVASSLDEVTSSWPDGCSARFVAAAAATWRWTESRKSLFHGSLEMLQFCNVLCKV